VAIAAPIGGRNMKILSFDQSTNLTGYCLIEDKRYIASGVIDKHKNKDTDARIAEMGLAMCKKIKEYKPDICVIEDIQKQSNTKTVIYLARLQGAIILYCASKGVPIKILHPSEWRRILQYKQGKTVKREELKQQSIDYIKEHFGFEKPEDESEAIAINVAACKLYTTE
jgi:Holliday junction resolvasome RuvABC endonuclease subunit